MSRSRTYAIVILLIAFAFRTAGSSEKTYYVLGHEQGLRGRHVLQMLQLTDGRMVMVTESHINMYDGTQFNSIALDKGSESGLSGYKGHTHLYVDAADRMWIKGRGRVACLNLKTLRYIDGCTALFSDKSATDFFVDSDGGIWTVRGDTIRGNGSRKTFVLPEAAGRIQDIDIQENRILAFTSAGMVCVFDATGGHLLARRRAYGAAEAGKYNRTSLVAKSSDGLFWQIRMGKRRSVLQTFSPDDNEWTRILECDYPLHTLMVAPGGSAYITTPHGYLTINPKTGEQNMRKTLRLPDGTRLATGINTVCRDREGGIWLGTYDKGVLYLSPLSGIFDTRENNVTLTPVMTAVTLNGRKLVPGDRQMAHDAPYVEHLALNHDENSLTFIFSTMKYVRPRNVRYRYRLCGLDNEWHEADADTDTPNRLVDDRGTLTLPFTALPPGDYTLEVTAAAKAGAWNGGIRRLTVSIGHPWWQSAWAYAAYILLLSGCAGIAVWIYTRHVRRITEQRGREEMLLMRIHGLIEKCNRYESSMNIVLTDKDDTGNGPEMNQAEMAFLNRATALVEQHIDDTAYSVEQLSRDLCMERTGLYRKLTAILDKSPQTFIRSIRLHKADELLAHGGMTVTEVAEATGFSSASYFTKCYQKEFGCRPSERANT